MSNDIVDDDLDFELDMAYLRLLAEQIFGDE